jgi:hypothetical protein
VATVDRPAAERGRDHRQEADQVTFTGRDLEQVEVVSLDGLAPIYFTIDGSAPTVAGAKTYVIPAAIGSKVVAVPTSGATVVRLISVGGPTYSVQTP